MICAGVAAPVRPACPVGAAPVGVAAGGLAPGAGVALGGAPRAAASPGEVAGGVGETAVGAGAPGPARPAPVGWSASAERSAEPSASARRRAPALSPAAPADSESARRRARPTGGCCAPGCGRFGGPSAARGAGACAGRGRFRLRRDQLRRSRQADVGLRADVDVADVFLRQLVIAHDVRRDQHHDVGVLVVDLRCA